jgi:ankyrin repeat protein
MLNKNKHLRYCFKRERLAVPSKAGVLWLALVVATVAGCASTGGGLDAQRLSTAITIDDTRYVRALVGSKAISPNQAIPGSGYAATPMITVAARHASINVLRYLIEARADLNARTPDRDTPLMLAAIFGKDEAVLNSSAFARYDLAVRLLVEAGASIDNVEPNTDKNAYTPLSYAAYAGRDNTVRYLLEKGAKVNANANTQSRTSDVNTPLMMAATQGHRNTALLLLRANADATVRVNGGMTALEQARKNRHTHLEQMLRCAESLTPGENFRQRCE